MTNEKLKKTINYINLLSALILTGTLLLDNYKIQNLLFGVFFSSYIIEFFTDKKWLNFSFDRKTIYFSGILLFFLLALAYYPIDLDKTQQYFKIVIERRYPLLGFSVVGIFGVNHLYRLRYFVITLVLTSASAIVYLLFFRVGILHFIQDSNLFNIARIQYVNTHMIMNFYLNSAVIGVWYLLSNYWTKINIPLRFGMILSVFVFLYILSISEGRSGFLFGLAAVLLLGFIELWEKKKKYAILFGALTPWIAIALIVTHPRMDYDKIKTEPRYFLWEAGLSVISQSPVLGHGISGAQTRFDAAREKYQTEEYKLNWIQSKHLDSHNQYIQTTMEFGIIGLSLLFFIFLSPCFLVINRRKRLTQFFIALAMFQSVFDMFATGFFSALFCLWLIFLIRTGKRPEQHLIDEKQICSKAGI